MNNLINILKYSNYIKCLPNYVTDDTKCRISNRKNAYF